MVDPVPGNIPREGKVGYGISVDLIIEPEDDTEANVRKGGMRRFGENVIV